MKKICFILILFLLLSMTVCAEEIDTNALEDSLSGSEYYSFFGNINEIIDGILSNTLELNGNSIFENIFQIFTLSFNEIKGSLAGIFAVSLVICVVESLDVFGKNAEKLATMGGKVIITAMILTTSIKLFKDSEQALNVTCGFTEALMPVLVTLLASCGAQGSVGILSPSMSFISVFIIKIIVSFIYPLLIVGISCIGINSALNENRLQGITDIIKSVCTWAIGGLFSFFAAILAIQGGVSAVSDGLSIRGIKYTLSGSVPVIGGSVSESIGALLSGGYYLKNVVGIMGIIVIAGILIMPLFKMIIYILVLKLTGALSKILGCNSVSSITDGISEYLKLGVISIVGISFLYFIYLGILCAAGEAIV